LVYGRLAKWAADEPERKRKEAEERRQRLERKRAGPKHTFDDTDYMEQIKSTEEEMDGALKQGEREREMVWILNFTV
jgi:hypothetical protein